MKFVKECKRSENFGSAVLSHVLLFAFCNSKKFEKSPSGNANALTMRCLVARIVQPGCKLPSVLKVWRELSYLQPAITSDWMLLIQFFLLRTTRFLTTGQDLHRKGHVLLAIVVFLFAYVPGWRPGTKQQKWEHYLPNASVAVTPREYVLKVWVCLHAYVRVYNIYIYYLWYIIC